MKKKYLFVSLLAVMLAGVAYAYSTWIECDFADYGSNNWIDNYDANRGYMLKADLEGFFPEGCDADFKLVRTSDNFVVFSGHHITATNYYYEFTVPTSDEYKLSVNEVGGFAGRVHLERD